MLSLENLVESDNDEQLEAERLIDLPLLHPLPADFTQDLAMIEQILLEYGAKKIILYGSLARDDYHPDSDIDICVQGLPNKHYFRALAECLMKTTHRMSIVDFKNTHGYFRERIIREGRLIAMNVEALQEEPRGHKNI